MVKRKKPIRERKRMTRDERLAREARRLADLLIATDAAITAPPAMLNDPRLAMARQFWDDHAPRLARLGTLDELSRVNLALLSVYVADFVIAEDDILQHGFSVRVKTISGDRMPRDNPAVARRDHAAKMIIDLGRHFGLTKLDRMNLQRLRRGAGVGPLFDDVQGQTRVDDQAAPTAIEQDGLDWERLTTPVRPN
jgi:phage terminase small subunit